MSRLLILCVSYIHDTYTVLLQKYAQSQPLPVAHLLLFIVPTVKISGIIKWNTYFLARQAWIVLYPIWLRSNCAAVDASISDIALHQKMRQITCKCLQLSKQWAASTSGVFHHHAAEIREENISCRQDMMARGGSLLWVGILQQADAILPHTTASHPYQALELKLPRCKK